MPFQLLLVGMLSLFVSLGAFPLKTYGQASSSNYGVYDLNSVDSPFSQIALDAPYIVGLSPRVGWGTVEPSEGQYDWSFLDGVFQTAIQHNKRVYLRVHPGVFTPDWVYQAGAKKVTGSSLGLIKGAFNTFPVPWDSVFLTKWKALVVALGNRYNSNPALYIVGVAGPTYESIEFYLPSTETAWQKFGYTPNNLFNAWKQCIDAYAQAFPSKNIALNIETAILGNQQLPQQIVNYGLNTYKSRVFVQGDWLSSDTTENVLDAMFGLTPQTTVGFQMVGTSVVMGSLSTAINNGLEGGASYLEIYEYDINNLSNSALLQSATTQLQIPPDQRDANSLAGASLSQEVNRYKDPEGKTTPGQLVQ